MEHNVDAEVEAAVKEALTEREMYLFNSSISNVGYHYHGSAKFLAQAGKGK